MIGTFYKRGWSSVNSTSAATGSVKEGRILQPLKLKESIQHPNMKKRDGRLSSSSQVVGR